MFTDWFTLADFQEPILYELLVDWPCFTAAGLSLLSNWCVDGVTGSLSCWLVLYNVLDLADGLLADQWLVDCCCFTTLFLWFNDHLREKADSSFTNWFAVDSLFNDSLRLSLVYWLVDSVLVDWSCLLTGLLSSLFNQFTHCLFSFSCLLSFFHFSFLMTGIWSCI